MARAENIPGRTRDSWQKGYPFLSKKKQILPDFDILYLLGVN